MKIIKLLELDENAQILKEKEMEGQAEEQSELNFDKPSQNDLENNNISGQWILLDELLEIDNRYLVYLKNEENEMTWIKLPQKYVEENYLVDYEPEDECPLGIDALIKEDGYPIGVIAGCDSIKQAKVDNNLDGHKYKGELGIKLNSNYFLTFNQKEEVFNIIETNVDWDRGKRTI